MGMFDYINYEAPCPKCGKVLKTWQSKDGLCTLGTVEPYEVDHFHSLCDSCKTWIDIQVERNLTIIVNKLVLYTSFRHGREPVERGELDPIDLTEKYKGEKGKIVNSGP